ncbi:hypothetical protein [Oculatella sp. FACHB-28]|nr:hypothetical protein [Oculatella sp. FACHB-28]
MKKMWVRLEIWSLSHLPALPIVRLHNQLKHLERCFQVSCVQEWE